MDRITTDTIMLFFSLLKRNVGLFYIQLLKLILPGLCMSLHCLIAGCSELEIFAGLLVIRCSQLTVKLDHVDHLQAVIDSLQRNVSQKSNMIFFIQIKGLKIGEMIVTGSINCGYPTVADGQTLMFQIDIHVSLHCAPALSNCLLPFFLALFCTINKLSLKETEELTSGLVFCPDTSEQQHREQYRSECEVLRKQERGEGRESNFAAWVQMHVTLFWDYVSVLIFTA